MNSSTLARNAFVAAIALSGLAAMTPTAAQAQTPGFTFSKSRPRLVVLLHGVTAEPAQDKAIGVGTSKHARHYWGFKFIKGLQGRTDETTMRVITPRNNGTFKFRTESGVEWQPTPPEADPSEMAPICYPISWNTSLPPGIESNQTLIKDYIRLMTKNGADSTMVMVNTRDGSKHLIPQVTETVEEIYHSYMAAFGSLDIKYQPQIYLVGHSFGGVIARAIMANPTGADLWGNKLSPGTRTKCEFLRSRVVLINTLSSPHLGCQIGDPSADVAQYLKTNGPGIIQSALNTYGTITHKNYSQIYIKNKTNEVIKAALDAVAGERDCLQDLMRQPEYNAGILHPSTMKRPNGELVPIYTASGRNPGNLYYERSRSVFLLGGGAWNPHSTLDFAMNGNRGAREAMALNIIEGVLHRKGYGKQGTRPYGTATIAAGDRVRGPYMGVGPSVARNLSDPLNLTTDDLKFVISQFLSGKPYTFNQGDGEWDNDGFLGWDSGHGLGLSGSNWYRVFDQATYGTSLPWDQDNHGSLMFNPGNGQWIHNELIREAGPIVAAGKRRSIWGSTDTPVTPKTSLKIEVMNIKDIENDIDWATQADFTLKISVGGAEATWNGPEDTKLVDYILHKIPAYTVTNYASSIVPIKIEVIERDQPWDPDDPCTVTGNWQRDNLHLFYDARTKRITGDKQVESGEIFTVNPNADIANKVQLRLRITGLN